MASELKHTVAPSGGDFTSLDACIDHLVAAHANFVTADVYGLVEISGTWSSADTSAVAVQGLTLDSTRYLSIYTDASNRASLSWSTSIYQLLVANASALTIQDDYVRVDGLQIGKSSSSANSQACVYPTTLAPSNAIWVSNCLLKQAGNNSYREPGIQSDDPDANIYCWNTAIYGSGTADHSSNSPVWMYGGTLWAYSCTAIGGKYGFYLAGSGKTYTLKNCYAGGSATEDFYVTGTGTTLNKTNCASEDQSADDTNAANPAETATNCVADAVAVDTDTFVNVTAGSQDFHLAADGLSPLQGAGVDTSGDGAPLNFTTDIDGDTRSAWSIGADDGPSAGGYTITCDGGSYAVTGQDATPKRDGKVAADAGSYTLTGQDAATLYGRLLAAEAGAYLLGGQDAGLLLGREVTAEAGAYALTGQEAALLRAARIAAEAGAYVLVGEDATLVYTPGGGAYILTAEGGVYGVTGLDAGLRKTSLIAAEAGAYVLTGMDAATLLGRLIDAGAGVYALTGLDTALLRAAKVAAEAGAYNLTGADIAALWGRVVSAEAGSYALTGADASLLRDALLALDRGSYAVTGTDASLSWSGLIAYPIIRDILARRRIWDAPRKNRIQDAAPRTRIFEVDRRR